MTPVKKATGYGVLRAERESAVSAAALEGMYEMPMTFRSGIKSPTLTQ